MNECDLVDSYEVFCVWILEENGTVTVLRADSEILCVHGVFAESY